MAKKNQEDRTIPTFAKLFGERGPWFFLTPDKEQRKKQKRAEKLMERALERHFRGLAVNEEKAARRKLRRLVRELAEAGNGESP
jgi:hypothetical protein